MAELVDKQGVIDAFNCEINITGKKNAEAVVDAIKGIAERINTLPVIEPRAKGKWIDMDSISDAYEEYRCPFCGKDIVVDPQAICDIGFTIKDFKFCLNCGAYLWLGDVK